MYEKFLDPDLYDSPWIASFIENLNEPEIDGLSDEAVYWLAKQMMPTDDIYGLLQSLHQSAQEKIKKTGTLAPEFVAFTDINVPIRFSSRLPQTPKQVDNFLIAAKCLSLVRCCQCIFFSAMQPIKDGKPFFAQNVDDNCDWGLLTIGSSLRGNCFIMLSELLTTEKFSFKIIEDKITREKEYNYPYSRFYHIDNYEEMEEIINQIPKLVNRTECLAERESLVNFASTLKALQRFGYGT